MQPTSASPIASVSLAAPARLVWRLLACELAMVAVVFALLWPTTHSLFTYWLDTDITTYTHGFLVLAISVALMIRDRHALFLRSQPSFGACVALCALSVLWLIAYRAAIQTAHQLLLLVIVWCAIAAAFGLSVAKRRLFAVGYLVFAIPVWGSVNGILQSLTVQVSDVLLRATGVPAYVEGNHVHLAAGVFEVAGGCSGLHFVIVGLALAALYGEINDDPIRTRIKLLAMALFLSIAANWMRVYTIIVAGYFTDMQHYLVRVSHYEFGWGVFAIAMMIFFWAARRMPASAAEARVAVAAQTLSSKVLARSMLLGLGAVAIGPIWNALAPVTAAEDNSAEPLVNERAGWIREPNTGPLDWHPTYAGADRQQLAQFVKHDRSVAVYTAEYRLQKQRHELVTSDNSLVGAADEVIGVAAVSGPVDAIESEVRVGNRSYLMWHYYQVGSRRMTQDLMAQLAYAAASLVSNPMSRIVALRAECVPDCAAARDVLNQFAADVGGELQPDPER